MDSQSSAITHSPQMAMSQRNLNSWTARYLTMEAIYDIINILIILITIASYIAIIAIIAALVMLLIKVIRGRRKY